MEFERPLLKLPRRFCAETLAAEVAALPSSAWIPHPDKIPGNDAVLLVSPGGRMTDDFRGPMAPTDYLLQSRYIMEIMAELDGVWGRSRLMGLMPGAEVPPHIDVHYYWRTHTRIHIPIITNPDVTFTCGGEKVHMAAGECWIFDSFRPHNVHNGGTAKRVHLVLDTVPGEKLWSLAEEAHRAGASADSPVMAPGQRASDSLVYEQVNVPHIMSPWEIRSHVAFLRKMALPDPLVEPVFRRIDRFIDGWAASWAHFGERDEGIPTYQRLIASLQRDLTLLGGARLRMTNQALVYIGLREFVLTFALPTAAPGESDARRQAS